MILISNGVHEIHIGVGDNLSEGCEPMSFITAKTTLGGVVNQVSPVWLTINKFVSETQHSPIRKDYKRSKGTSYHGLTISPKFPNK